MARYVCWAGTGASTRGGSQESLTASEVATLYGLEAADYEVGDSSEATGTVYDHTHIHLRPRTDGVYRNIKTELGDNGTSVHYRKMVNAEKWKKENDDHGTQRYRS
jgi:diadenosine tetraphosphate (Ap4A) HIT family hydrolase